MKMKEQYILVVDSNHGDLQQLKTQLTGEGFLTTGASSPEEVDDAMNRQLNIKLVLLDITGFDNSIWERCAHICNARIPCIVLTPQRSPAIQRKSMKYNVSGLLIKPVAFSELIEHMHVALGDQYG